MAIPHQLKQRLSEGKVIPFIGAGVSIAVKRRETDESLFPSWRELLKRAIDRLASEDKGAHAKLVSSFLDLNNYLEAAKYAREGLAGNWPAFLKEQLDPLRADVDDISLSLPSAVWELGSKLVITTNYDRVLRWACPNPTDISEWDIQATAEQSGTLQHGLPQRPTIWHLHGQIGNAAELVLTPDGYNKLYSSGRCSQSAYDAAITTLQTYLATYTFLFIGFSLVDQYFGGELRAVNDVFQGLTGPHYVLVREQDRPRVEELRLSVQPIPYSDHGEPLLELLSELKLSVNETQSRITVPDLTNPKESTQTDLGNSQIIYDPRNPVFSIPFRPKEDQVIGREDALEEVRRQLFEGSRTPIGRTAAIIGIGGIGKTQLAVEYASQSREKYQNGVIWLNADQDIDAQLTELADKAHWISPLSEHKDKLDIARRRLRSRSDCLLIFDNVNSLESIAPYLPEPDVEPHILITSQTDQVGFISIRLDPLNSGLSYQLLLQEAGREPPCASESSAAQSIADSLDGLPLAIELAGAYLRHVPTMSWCEYSELLNYDFKGAFPKQFASFTKHQADLYRTLKLNESLFSDQPRLRDILDVLTWSGTAPMSTSLLCALLDVENTVEISGALGLGSTLRLLQKSPDADAYAIHRLVGQVRRDDIPLSGRRKWVSDVCQSLGDWFQTRREEYNNLPVYEAEIDHLNAWLGHSLKYASKHGARLTWLQAYPPYHRGSYRESHEWVSKALALFQQNQLDDRALYAHLLTDKGVTKGWIGQTEGHLQLFLEAFELRVELFGSSHVDTATSLDNVGTAYGNLGNYHKQLEFVERALNLRRELLGERDLDTAKSLVSVGNAYGLLGDYQQQLEFTNQALVLRRELLGERHPDTAASVDGVGLAFGNLGDYQKQLELSLQALHLRRELLGVRHPITADSLDNVALAYGNLGDYQKQLELTMQALQLRQELLGERHPITADSLNGVADAYGNLGDNQKELEFAMQGLELRRELLGECHPDTASSLNGVGLAYGRLGNYQKQLEFTMRALELRRKLLGERHPTTAASINSVGCSYGNLGDYQKKLTFTQRALELRREFLGERHPDIATMLASIGIAHGNLGDYGKQLEFAEKALNMRRELLGERHPDIADSLDSVGYAHRKLNNKSLAVEFRRKAVSLARDLFGEEHPSTILYLNNLVWTMVATSQRLDALPLIEEIQKHLPKECSHYEELEELKARVTRRIPGLRQPPRGTSRKKKNRR